MVNIALFGSTGSVGEKVLNVVRIFPNRFSVKALGARKNVTKALQQAKEFNPKYIYIDKLPESMPEVCRGRFRLLTGYEGIGEICSDEEIDVIIVAVDGYFGVFPTVEGIKNGKRILTANKESVFMWGYEIMEMARERGVEVVPMDSEHNAIYNLLHKLGKENVVKYLITASGGPLLSRSFEDLENIKFSDVMCHPNWRMGKVVTFNSATMFNKLLEVFEAHVFFGIDIDEIEVVIHPESRIHSMVLLKDGTVWSVYYAPDMIFPVANAMFYPELAPLVDKNIHHEVPKERSLSFLSLDLSKFPVMSLLRDIKGSDRRKRVILNVANEVCLSLFEVGEIKFTCIPEILKKCFYEFSTERTFDISGNLEKEIDELREEIRNFVVELSQ